MQVKAINLFLLSAVVLLFSTACAKIVSAMGHDRILNTPDFILAMPLRDVLLIASGAELFVAFTCLLDKNTLFKTGLVSALATGFMVYRLGRWWIGYPKLCPCLGTLTSALHISPSAADTIMTMVAAYLVLGSYTASFYIWQQRKRWE